MSKIIVPISNGFEEIEAVTIIDIFRRAGLDVTIATVEDIQVIGANGIIIKADIRLSELKHYDEYDLIVIPGGGKNTQTLAQNDLLKEMLQKFDKDEKYIGAICAAPYVLHNAGVLKTNYTCYPGMEKEIGGSGYTPKAKYIVDENIITSAGPATAVCFALEIVKIIESNNEYEKIKEDILADYCHL